MIEESRWPAYMLRAAVFLICVFIALPIVTVFIGSFTSDDAIMFPPRSFGIRWYAEIFNGYGDLLSSCWISFQLATASAGISTIIGLLASLAAVRRKFVGRDQVMFMLQSPLLVPAIVIGIALLQFLTWIGMGFTATGLLIAHVIMTVPFTVRLITASLTGMDPALDLAARSLGANRLRVLWHITLPLIRAGLISGFLFAFIMSFENVTVSLFLVSPELVTFPVKIFGFVENSPSPIVTAASALLLIFATALIVVLQFLVGIDRLWAAERR